MMLGAMNRTQLAMAISERSGITRSQAKTVVDVIIGQLVIEAKRSNRIRMFDLGTFTISRTPGSRKVTIVTPTERPK